LVNFNQTSFSLQKPSLIKEKLGLIVNRLDLKKQTSRRFFGIKLDILIYSIKKTFFPEKRKQEQ